MIPIEDCCYWLSARRREGARTPDDVSGDLPGECDIAIVGGGFTGLWTALFLKELEPSTRVVVCERETTGYGASGRNAGIVGETLDHSHELAAKHFGEDEARTLARIGRENLDEMESFLAARGIDAAFERTGQLIVALSEAHVAELARSVESAHRLGAGDWRLLAAEEAQSEIASSLYRGAIEIPGNAIVDPVKLVDGLAREARRLGVVIRERCAVTGFDFPADVSSGASGATLRCVEGGEPARDLRVRKIILATNAYTHHLYPRLARRFIPLYDYIIVSEPLTAAQRENIGWRRRQGVTDARAFFNYYRLTPDDRILWGTSEAVYHRGNGVDAAFDQSAPHTESLRASFRRHFPALSDLAFPFAWGGPIASTTRLTPFFGSAERGRLLYGLGYTGHGIGSSRVAGKILAHRALERHSPLLDLTITQKPPFPYPPEPLRSIAVSMVTNALRRVDRGGRPGTVLRALDAAGIGFSS